MPALMNSRVGSLAGMIEADPIRACWRWVKKPRKVSRISSLLYGRVMQPRCQAPARAASDFPAAGYSSTWPATQVTVPPPTQIVPSSSRETCTRP